MCTVTLLRHGHRTIVTMNRDELKNRHEGAFCRASTTTGINYLYPVDPVSNGTWLGINALGLGACLLNRYGDTHLSDTRHIISRGTIIPSLLECDSLEQAYRKLDQLPLHRFRNFDILLFDESTVLQCTHKNGHGTVKPGTGNRLMLSSSSWNKIEVLKFRQRKFIDYASDQKLSAESAESVLCDFHLSNTDDSRFGILMNRPESHTKSVSQIILYPDKISFRYIDEATLESFAKKPLDKSAACAGTTYTLARQ